MTELVKTLLAWITAATGLAMPPPPPIVLLSSAQMTELAYGPNAPVSEDLRAMYDCESSVVYLRKDWSAVDLRSRASLLHELVHHVQLFNKVPARCLGAREVLAYDLTLKWLKEQGASDPYEILDIDPFTIRLLCKCPEG